MKTVQFESTFTHKVAYISVHIRILVGHYPLLKNQHYDMMIGDITCDISSVALTTFILHQ